MIQKKREQFRLSIRRRQIEALFRDIRLDLLEPKVCQQSIQYFKESQFTQAIIGKLKQIRIVIQSNNQNEISAHFFALKQSIMSQISGFSTYFTVFSKQFNNLIHSLFENRTVISEGQRQWRTVSQDSKKYSLIQILDIYLLIAFQNIKKQSFEVILESLLKYFDHKQFLFFSQDKQILEKILQVFKKILQVSNKVLIQVLLSMGFEGLVQEILNKWKSFTITNVHDLLYIMHRYLFLQSSLKKNQQSSEINGVTVFGSQSSSKKAILIFASQTFDKNIKNTQLLCLSILQLIFQRHNYLIDQLSLKSIKNICLSILKFEAPCIKKGLQLVCDIIYYSESIVEQLLENNFISDIILNIMNSFQRFPYKDVRQYSYLLSCTITNLILCRERNLIKSFMIHPLWQKAYENIRMESPMLPLVASFEYFFQKVSKKIGIQTFDRYLFSISQINMSIIDRRQAKAILNTVQRTFIHCIDFWPQQNDIRLKRLIDQYHLGYMIQQLIIPEEQEMEMNSI